MKAGVVVFPGSNCDHDVYHVWKHVLGQPATFLWHDEPSLQGCELIVLPGGFSYGDYVRAGVMAARSPIIASVQRHADAGGLVLGICNGFQILLEAGLLPGAMRRNVDLRFLSRDVHLRVERADLPFTHRLEKGQVLRMPIAHGEGSYYDNRKALDELERREGRWGIVRRVVTNEWIGEIDGGRERMQSLRGLYLPGRWDREDISYQRPLTDESLQATTDDDFQQSSLTSS